MVGTALAVLSQYSEDSVAVQVGYTFAVFFQQSG